MSGGKGRGSGNEEEAQSHINEKTQIVTNLLGFLEPAEDTRCWLDVLDMEDDVDTASSCTRTKLSLIIIKCEPHCDKAKTPSTSSPPSSLTPPSIIPSTHTHTHTHTHT